jgi:hypothetical protein
MCPTKTPLKIYTPLPEVKLLMFSKGNSSEGISFLNHPRQKTGQWFPI